MAIAETQSHADGQRYGAFYSAKRAMIESVGCNSGKQDQLHDQHRPDR
ncbi:hypothetical protein [Sinorhizobium chiapasense]|uniref:Uncharacterized protein n=1 Tax=Sinorhizobium chiapasense TaxID=501572 RepID=A0ABZ2BJ12_9HYPH